MTTLGLAGLFVPGGNEEKINTHNYVQWSIIHINMQNDNLYKQGIQTIARVHFSFKYICSMRHSKLCTFV